MIQPNSLNAWFLAARPKTLTGAIAPVLVGAAFVYAHLLQGEVNCQLSTINCQFILCLLFAMLMQIDANLINDFFDFKKGTDREDRLGPERACAQGWVSIDRMKHAIAATTVLACIVGLPLVWFGGLEMILIGLLCVVFCFLYTTHLSYLGLGDVLVLVFFGLIPVSITYYIQLHTVTIEVLVASLACGLVIDGLLLVNNFRDRDTDKTAGKNTLVVRIGEKAAIWLYFIVGIVACLAGLVFGLNGNWWAFALPFIYLVLHLLTFLKMKRIWKGRELNKCLGETARNIFIYGLLVTVGILIA